MSPDPVSICLNQSQKTHSTAASYCASISHAVVKVFDNSIQNYITKIRGTIPRRLNQSFETIFVGLNQFFGG